MNIRKNHELRMRAFDELIERKKRGIPLEETIDKINSKFQIKKANLKDWYNLKYKPNGRRAL